MTNLILKKEESKTYSFQFNCSYCKYKSKKKLRRCSRCNLAFYCNKNCQKLHWKKSHKKECKTKEEKLKTTVCTVLTDELSNKFSLIRKSIEQLCKGKDTEQIWKEITKPCTEPYAERYIPRYGPDQEITKKNVENQNIFRSKLNWLFMEYIKSAKGKLNPAHIEKRLRKEHHILFSEQPTYDGLGGVFYTKTSCFPVALIAAPVDKRFENCGIVGDAWYKEIKNGYFLRIYVDGTMKSLNSHLFFKPSKNLKNLERAGNMMITNIFVYKKLFL